LHFRVSIEGFPYEPVSSADMEGTATDGRSRFAGLISKGIKLSERVDLSTAKWEPRGFRLQIADVNRKWTEAFKAPTAVTYLAADATAASTTYSVKATAAFDTSGQVWLDSETATYAAKTSAGFSGLTRGIWQTLAQGHYTADGELLRYPEVTNWPRVREGRRVSLYVYGAGDPRSASDAGTLIWTGVVSTEPQFDGLRWKIGIDPISRKWSQDVGGDLEDLAPIRGIYYPANAPLHIEVTETTAADHGGPAVAKTRFAMAGFWESQEAFCTALTAELATQIAIPEDPGFTQSVECIAIGEGWGFSFETGATPHYMSFEVISATDELSSDTRVLDSGDDRVWSVATSARYTAPVAMGQVPRSTFGSFLPSARITRRLRADRQVNIDSAPFPSTRLYLGGRSSITANINYAAIEWDSNGAAGATERGEGFDAPIASISTTNRSMTLDASVVDFRAAQGPDRVSVRMGRSYGIGHLGDFIDTLTGDVAANLNRGAVPDIRSGDFVAMSATDIPAVAASSPLTIRRRYNVFSPVAFEDVVKEECKLLGVFPAYNSSGLVTFHRLRYAAAGEVATKTITGADIITGKGEWLRYEIAPLGLFNTVDLETGYDAVEDEHLGRLRRVRDVESFGRSPDGRTLEVAPLSGDDGIFGAEDVVKQMGRILGVFGAPYYYVSFAVKLSLIDLLVGDIVKVTWNKIPNPDGTLGVTNRIGYIVAREWDLRNARGKLTILLTDSNVAGYTPAAQITVTDGGTGTTGPFTATAATTHFPGSTSADDFWQVDDLIRLFGYDTTATTNNALGTITAVSGNTLTFTTTANWTHDGGESWVLGSRVSTAIVATNQRAYAYIGNADMTLDFSGSTGNAPFTIAP